MTKAGLASELFRLKTSAKATEYTGHGHHVLIGGASNSVQNAQSTEESYDNEGSVLFKECDNSTTPPHQVTNNKFEQWKGMQQQVLEGLSHKLKQLPGLGMAHINVRSLPPKLDQVSYILEKTNVDVLSINETWLDGSIGDAELHIEGYDIIRNDRNRLGGGVALYITNKLRYHLRDDLLVDDLEAGMA